MSSEDKSTKANLRQVSRSVCRELQSQLLAGDYAPLHIGRKAIAMGEFWPGALRERRWCAEKEAKSCLLAKARRDPKRSPGMTGHRYASLEPLATTQMALKKPFLPVRKLNAT